MNKFVRYHRGILALTILLAAAGGGVLFWALPEDPAWAWGLELGAIVGLIGFRLKVNAVLRFCQPDAPAAPRFQVKTAFQTYALMLGAILLAVWQAELFNAWTVFIGLVIPQGLLIADGVIRPTALSPDDSSVNSRGGVASE